MQKVRNAAETSVVWAGPQNHLAELRSSLNWAVSSTVPASPCKLSDHLLEQLLSTVTACPFTLPDAAARSWYARGGGATSCTHHAEIKPSHPPLSFGTAQLWDSLNQTCRVVWPHYARRRRKKREGGRNKRKQKGGRERQSSLGINMFNDPFKPPQTLFTKPHRLSLNFFVKIFAFANSPRSMSFCISASQNASGALSHCSDFTGARF